jgi:hypothetical protein
MIENEQIMQDQEINRSEAPLFSLSVMSSHLFEYGMSPTSIFNIEKCGLPDGNTAKWGCSCETLFIPATYKCSQRACPRCSKRRKKRIYRDYLPYLTEYMAKRDSHYQLRFLTISPKNYDNLDYGLNHIRKSFSKFLRTKYIKERIKAGFYVIETKKLDKGWNIHIHAIIFSRYLDNRIRGSCLECGQSLLKFDYTSKKHYCASKKCNSLNVVKNEDSKLVSLFRNSSKRDCNLDIKLQNSTLGTIGYMCKYISVNKDDFSNIDDFALYVATTQKRLLISKFGDFYALKMKKAELICPKCGDKVVIEIILTGYFDGFGEEDPPPPNTIKWERNRHNISVFKEGIDEIKESRNAWGDN